MEPCRNQTIDEHTIKNVAENFGLSKKKLSVVSLGNGNIHQTYLASDENQEVVLQKINTAVFSQVESIAHNQAILRASMNRQKLPSGFLKFLQTCDGEELFSDPVAGVWRATDYVKYSAAYDVAKSVDIVKKAAFCFGQFLLFLSSVPAETFRYTIPDHADINARFEELHNAINEGIPARCREGKELYRAIIQYQNEAVGWGVAMRSSVLPKKIVHHDMKLNNVLFHMKNSSALCVIDLDLCMPGTPIFDFGDFIRSSCATADESESDIEKIDISEDYLHAGVNGFLDGVGRDYLEPSEMKFLPTAPASIAMMLAARFLTDFFYGDPYFGAKFENHNFIRARNQYQLGIQLLDKAPFIRSLL